MYDTPRQMVLYHVGCFAFSLLLPRLTALARQKVRFDAYCNIQSRGGRHYVPGRKAEVTEYTKNYFKGRIIKEGVEVHKYLNMADMDNLDLD